MKYKEENIILIYVYIYFDMYIQMYVYTYIRLNSSFKTYKRRQIAT